MVDDIILARTEVVCSLHLMLGAAFFFLFFLSESALFP